MIWILFFFFTQNSPKPEIYTSSLDSRECLISSRTIESVSFCHCVDDVGFGEGAGSWHGGHLLSFGDIKLSVRV
jgi:hypothetical protein